MPARAAEDLKRRDDPRMMMQGNRLAVGPLRQRSLGQLMVTAGDGIGEQDQKAIRIAGLQPIGQGRSRSGRIEPQ